jgi:hypothetical protein
VTREFNTTVLGGIPVTIEFRTTGFNNSDCGGGNDDVDDWEIVRVNGFYCRKRPDWIYKRLSKTEIDKIIEECYENI